MLQKQINNFVQINCTDYFSTADVTTRLLMDFGCVPGDQKNLYTVITFVCFYNDACGSGFSLDDDHSQFS